MSILNIAVGAGVALVAVDTRGAALASAPSDLRAPLGGGGDVCKMIHLSSANAVLAGRGVAGFMALVQYMVMARYCTGFDGLLQCLPPLLSQCWAAFEQQARQGGMPDTAELQSQEIAVVGWSSTQRRMAAAVFAQESAAEGFERFDVACSWVTPWADEQGESPTLTDEASMTLAAIDQVAHTTATAPHVGIGGRLVLAKLTQWDCLISHHCEL